MKLRGVLKTGVHLTNSDTKLRFRKGVLSVTTMGYDLGIETDLGDIEVVQFIDKTMSDLRNGYAVQSAWENPEIRDIEYNFTSSQKLALGYYIMLSFVMNSECGTRDVWAVFKGVHNSLISYIRHRAVASHLLLQYKIAILTCKTRGYTVADSYKIQQVFLNCGLDAQNYIFYLIMLLDGMDRKIVFDQQDKFILSVASIAEEASDFIHNKQTTRLCAFHAHTKLAFITQSQRDTPQDMINELLMATNVAYLTSRPLRSRAYSENYARRTMTNMVNRIIHAYTTYEGKVRLRSDTDGYQNTHMELNDKTFTMNFNPQFDHAIVEAANFNEDRMIAYLDEYRAIV